MANFIRKNVPQIEEVPMAPLIVFTAKNIAELDVKSSRVPAMHHTKLKGYLRQQKDSLPPLPAGDYAALRAAFDNKAGRVIEELDGNPA
jgi:hypothetical protein